MDAIYKKIVKGKERQNYFKIARNKSYQLKQYVDTLFDWAKLYSNEYIIANDYIDVSDLTRKILVDCIPVFEENKINYDIYIPEYKVTIHIDVRAYETIILNIVQNVIDHSCCKNIIIELINSNHSIMVIIKDDGIGISQEYLINIFDRLYKVDKSRSTLGNGLGLSIVKQFVEKLDGNVTVKSKLNEGIEFQIKIPKDTHWIWVSFYLQEIYKIIARLLQDSYYTIYLRYKKIKGKKWLDG